MKKLNNPNPSKVIIIPQTPQNNKSEEEAPQGNTPTMTQAPPQGPAEQEACTEMAAEEDAE